MTKTTLKTERKPQCKRKFGKTTVTISKSGRIIIAGDWFTNYGIIYSHNIERFKSGQINPTTGFKVQVIGMDTNVSKTHLEYIYGRINAGKFDHLVKDLVSGVMLERECA